MSARCLDAFDRGNNRPPPAIITQAAVADDPVVEQLYDELLARTWATHLITGVPAVDITRDAVRQRVSMAAAALIANLRRTRNCAELRRVLWPAIPPPEPHHPWWHTPLGRTLVPAPAVPEPQPAKRHTTAA